MKKFNINEFIWFLILVFNFIFLSYIVITNKAFLIVNENIKKYLIIAIAIIGMFVLIQITKIFTIPSRNGIKCGNLIFIFAACCLILFTKINIAKVSLDFKGVKLYHDIHFNTNHHEHNHTVCMKDENILLNKNNFHESLEEIIKHLDEYLGKNIIVEGIVYLDKKYESSFVLTELNMNCCIVDSEYLGILCEGDMKGLQSGEQLVINGEISKKKIIDKYNNEIWVPLVILK